MQRGFGVHGIFNLETFARPSGFDSVRNGARRGGTPFAFAGSLLKPFDEGLVELLSTLTVHSILSKAMLSSTASFDTAFGTASISHRRSSTESISSSSTDTLTDGSSDAELPATSSKPYSPSFAVKQTRQAKDWRPKATLHLRRDDSTRTFFERLVTRALMTDEYHELKPLNLDRGPIPVHPVAKEHAWILSRAFVALALQQLSYWVFPSEYGSVSLQKGLS